MTLMASMKISSRACGKINLMNQASAVNAAGAPGPWAPGLLPSRSPATQVLQVVMITAVNY